MVKPFGTHIHFSYKLKVTIYLHTVRTKNARRAAGIDIFVERTTNMDVEILENIEVGKQCFTYKVQRN